MKRILLSGVVLAVLLLGFESAAAGQWRFPVGLTYISGVGDIVDQYEDNLQAEGYSTDSVEGIPVGISLQPYYEYDSGLGIGFGFGPLMLIIGDVDFLNVPVNVCLRYALMSKSSTSVFFRAGMATNLVSGDYVEDSQIGLLGAVGVEFMRNRAVSVGIEIGFNSSTIELEDHTASNPNDTKEFEPTGFTASVYAVF
jgi:hypothetical protein